MRIAHSAVALALALQQLASAVPSAPSPTSDVPVIDFSVAIPELREMHVEGTMAVRIDSSSTREVRLFLSRRATNVSFGGGSSRTPPRFLVTSDSVGRDIRWTLKFASELAAGEVVDIIARYSIPAGTSSVFHIGPEGSFGDGNTAWLPQLSSRRGTRAKYLGRMQFLVAPPNVVVASGQPVSDLNLAKRGEFAFEYLRPTMIAFAAGPYRRIEHRGGSTPIIAYELTPRRSTAARLDSVAKVVDFLVELYGALPYASLGIVETPSRASREAGFGGAGEEGFLFADSSSMDRRFNVAFYAHEIGHQWWGDAITVTGRAGELLLTEGLAQYGSHRAVQFMMGDTAAERYRRFGYPDFNLDASGRGYLRVAAGGLDQPLTDLRGAPARVLALSKGFLVLNALASEMGRESFDDALKDLTRAFVGRSMSWTDFLKALQKRAPFDVSEFAAEWFDRPGAPEWFVDLARNGDGSRISIRQNAPYFSARVRVRLISRTGGTRDTMIHVKDSLSQVLLGPSQLVDSVVLDPAFEVVHWDRALAEEARGLKHFYRGVFQDAYGLTNDAFNAYTAGLDSLPSPDKFGEEFMLHYSLAGIEINRKRWPAALEHVTAALRSPVRSADQMASLFLRQAQIAAEMKDFQLLRNAVAAVVSAESAYGVGWGGGLSAQARALLARIP